MKLEFIPSYLRGEVRVPASKSILHRMLICAALADGVSHIGNFRMSDDISATVGCIKAAGADVSHDGDTLTVTGIGEDFAEHGRYCCLDSASTLRFMLPVSLTAGCGGEFIMSKGLAARPMSPYRDMCTSRGIIWNERNGIIRVSGRLSAGDYHISSGISSQFTSGLMLALPMTGSTSAIITESPEVSRPYTFLTAAVLRQFGVNTDRCDNRITINGRYTPADCTAEGDFSGAAYIDALALFGHDIMTVGLPDKSLQGDAAYRDFFARMRQSHCTLDITDTPDLAPVLMTAGCAMNGVTLTGCERLRYKESDRARVIAAELAKLSGKVTIDGGTVEVSKSTLHAPKVPLSSHGDHRVAMALSLPLTVLGGTLDGADAVNKSYPAFFDELSRLGAVIHACGDDANGKEEST